ncbi:MAG: hypothetical protein PHW98_03625 [Candidatus Omnitrophica bacterium]|nr:hypothetical protein [Candidatus Omnitrophota bacterium]
MILVVDTDLKEVKFWAFKEDKPEEQPVYFSLGMEKVMTGGNLKKEISAFTEGGRIKAISFRLLFGADYFRKPRLIGPDFFARFGKMTDFFPFYVPPVLNMLKVFYKEFRNIPQAALFETSFFSALPDEEKYYAVPREFNKNNRIKKWGFHGIFHEADCGINPAGRCISVVFDKQTTVCSVKNKKPLSISLGFTPLEGIMSRTSCGDLDPGIVFYLMNIHGLSIYRIDDILKNESGFLGLTGYDIELKEMVKLCGKDRKVDLAFDIYQAQLLKYIGEGISVLGGLDSIIFAGSQLGALSSVIYRLVKEISFLGISTKSLPWASKEGISCVSSGESRIKVYFNRMSLPKLIFCKTIDFLKKSK